MIQDNTCHHFSHGTLVRILYKMQVVYLKLQVINSRADRTLKLTWHLVISREKEREMFKIYIQFILGGGKYSYMYCTQWQDSLLQLQENQSLESM